MRFGVTLPNCGVGNDPAPIVELAVAAERAGWDGVFVWDTPYASDIDEAAAPMFDAWALMTSIVGATERVRVGTMITPLPWRRPWEVARQAQTLDQMSGGRFILSVGLGWVPEGGSALGEVSDRKERAEMLDESLEILERLWSGERFSFDGKYYRLKDVRFTPTPVQSPRIPIWVVAAWHTDPDRWPIKKSMRRALRYDGVLPNIFSEKGNTHEQVQEPVAAMARWIAAERSDPIDVICEGGGEKDDTNTDADTVRAWRDAGATWWLEAVWWSMYRHPGDPSAMRERVERGPPTI
jgi:hypothetical protein